MHADARAASAARELDASAFTKGQDVYFSAGQFRPGTVAGDRLLAHELTHTLQARYSGSVPGQSARTADRSRPGDRSERRAEQVADLVSHGRSAADLVRAPVGHAAVQRQELAPDHPASTALQQVREAITERQEIAGVGNFPKAFAALNPLSMHDMLLTLDALQPTHELDLLMANIGSAVGYDSSRIQTAAAAVREAHTGVDPVAATAGFAALPSDQQAEITTFIRLVGEAHETSALTHAAKYHGAGTSGVDVLQQMTLVSHAIAAGTAPAARLKSADGLEFLRIVVDRRNARLRTSTDPQEARRWSGQVAAQLDIVTRSTNGLTFATELLDAANAAAPGQVPSYIGNPMQVVGQAYAEALRQSDLVDTGYEKLAHADELAKNMQLDILAGTAADARRLLSEATTNATSNLEGIAAAQRDFAADIKHARDLLDTDPAKYAEELKSLQEKIATFHQRAVVISTRAQFEVMLNSVNTLSGKARDTHPEDSKALWELIRRITPFYVHWTTLERAYANEDKAAQEAGWAVVRGEGDQLTKLLKEVDAKVASVAHTLAVDEAIFRIAILVLVGLATGGFGDLLLGVAGGLELGSVATFALVTTGEALFFTTATTLIFEKDPTVGKFLSELAVNLATFGAMRGVSVMYKGILGPAAKTLPGTAGEVVVMLTAQTATSLALADHAKRASTGRGLSDDETHDIVLESVLVGVATMVGARVAHDMLPDFRARGTKIGQRLARINLGRAALRSRAAKITGGSTTATPGGTQPGSTTAQVLKAATAADVERVQQLLDDDAVQLKDEKAALTEIKSDPSVDPASKDALAVDAALTETQTALTKNEAAKIATALEQVGPDEAMCQQDRFDEVAAYHRRNPALTVTEAVDANGARTLLLAPKDPSQGKPFLITERLTAGSSKNLTQPPTAQADPAAPPVESKFKAFTDLLAPDGTFADATLEAAYQRYTAKKAKEGGRAKDRADWARSQTNGDYRKSLEGDLGPDFFKQGGMITLQDKARPRSYTPDRYLADYSELLPFVREVLAKAGIDPKVGIPGGRISQGAFNGAKGVVAEVLARAPENEALMKVRQSEPRAVIMRGLMMRLHRGGGTFSSWKLFTDGVIGYFDGPNLKLLGRIEVKSGPTGGQEATVQFFEWVEGRLTTGSELRVPGHDPVAYGPTQSQRAAGMGHVDGLANAPTYIVTPKGAENLGSGSAMQTVTTHTRIGLETTAPEIEFLTRLLLEPYITSAKP